MDWILDEVIDNTKARIQALENVIKDIEVHGMYAFAKIDEIRFLKDQLKEIEDMRNEDIKETELAEQDLQENKKRAYCE